LRPYGCGRNDGEKGEEKLHGFHTEILRAAEVKGLQEESEKRNGQHGSLDAAQRNRGNSVAQRSVKCNATIPGLRRVRCGVGDNVDGFDARLIQATALRGFELEPIYFGGVCGA
jgi:hypothetical protein